MKRAKRRRNKARCGATNSTPYRPQLAHRNIWWLFIALFALAFVVRSPSLSLRPMHGDEAVHAHKLGLLISAWDYEYNPYDFHGPSLYYFSIPTLLIRGVRSFATIPDAAALRLTTVLFGAGLILLLPLLSDAIPLRALILSALFIIFSPSFVFFSRYYIQEMLLVFFSFAFCFLCWRALAGRNRKWSLLAGFAAGMMYATKETAIITWGVMVLAYFAMQWSLQSKYITSRTHVLFFDPVNLIYGVGMAMLVSLLCLSSFLANPMGALDAIISFIIYIPRGLSGSGNESVYHHWPFYYYLRILLCSPSGSFVWTEGAIYILSIIAFIITWKRKYMEVPDMLVAYLSLLAVFLCVVYSTIPYKTPWCLLSFHLAFILLAGIGASQIYERLRRRAYRILWVFAMFLIYLHLAWQSYSLNYGRHMYSVYNPYLYAHPSGDFILLERILEQVARSSKDGYNTHIKVFAQHHDIWPLPWYIRQFSNYQFYDGVDDPQQASKNYDAPVIILKKEFVECDEGLISSKDILETRLLDTYKIRNMDIFAGSGAGDMYLYISSSVWNAVFTSEAED